MNNQTQQTNPDTDQVLIKAPGGGSISHAGVEYLPDPDGNILLPRRIKEWIESVAYHNDSSGRYNTPTKITLEEVG